MPSDRAWNNADLDYERGPFAVVWVNPGKESSPPGRWAIFATLNFSRWRAREPAEAYAKYRREQGDERIGTTIAIVLEWGDDLSVGLDDPQKLSQVSRVQEALTASAAREPATRECTCLGTCRGAAALAPGWTCAMAVRS